MHIKRHHGATLNVSCPIIDCYRSFVKHGSLYRHVKTDHVEFDKGHKLADDDIQDSYAHEKHQETYNSDGVADYSSEDNNDEEVDPEPSGEPDVKLARLVQ